MRSKFKWFLIAWSTITVLNLFQLAFYKFSVDASYSWIWVWKYPLIAFGLGVILMLTIVIPGYNILIKVRPILRVFGFVFHLVLYGLLFILILYFIQGILIDSLNFEWYSKMTRDYFISDFHQVAKNYLICIAILFAHDYFTEKSELRIQNLEIEKKLTEAQITNIKARLHPHFLFNTMNSIVGLIDENKKKAQKSLIELSDLLRYSIDQKAKLIPIEEEIELIKKYLSIEKSRHESQLEVRWYQHGEGYFNVPPFMLQPIIENSIKHGFKDLSKGLTVEIEIDRNEKVIRIKNNGKPLQDSYEVGVGIRLVQDQIKNYNGSYSIRQEQEWVINEIVFHDKS